MKNNKILLEIRNLKKYFPVSGGILRRDKGLVKAVDGVDLMIRRGETLGLVGESGCGKTTLGRVILRLEEPTDGKVIFEGENILDFNRQRLRTLRREMQIIFQDPYSSLNPRKTVADIIEDAFITHGIGDKAEREERVLKLMELVGLRPEYFGRYPREFSGGQRQRIGIARAIALNPKFIICDEPVSALDVSIQAQVINLLKDLQEELQLTYLFIAHDLNLVEHISDHVAVMYLGRVVEFASSTELYECPYHPYAEALISASPVPDPNIIRRPIILEGDIPSPLDPPAGCHFNTRCRYAIEKCNREAPPWEEITVGHWARCWRLREIRNVR